MEEKWVLIDDFPMYRISNFGDVVNNVTGKFINTSQTKQGLMKVGLVCNGIQYTRGLAILVAQAFVVGRSDIFNTPIHLDGDQTNNRADNLMWRPRWFAWKYFRQFEEKTYSDRGPIFDVNTGRRYETVLHAATEHGLLFKDIMRSVSFQDLTFPTGQLFTFRE